MTGGLRFGGQEGVGLLERADPDYLPVLKIRHLGVLK